VGWDSSSGSDTATTLGPNTMVCLARVLPMTTNPAATTSVLVNILCLVSGQTISIGDKL
jgi:hypothetical protein